MRYDKGVWVYIYIYIYTHTHTHTNTHTHIYIYIYIHIYMCVVQQRRVSMSKFHLNRPIPQIEKTQDIVSSFLKKFAKFIESNGFSEYK